MQRLVWWVQWHRRLGAVVALLVLLLAVTGILINHSQDMGWHQRPVYSPLLAWLYHIPMKPVTQGYAVDERWIVQSGEQIFLDRQPVQTCRDVLLGAVKSRDMLAVLCASTLLLLDERGELIEQINNLPAQPQALAVRDAQLLLQAGNAAFQFDENSGAWSSFSGPVEPVQSQSLPQTLQTYFSHHNPVPGLSRERVLLDLHSGRLFGRAGVWVADLVGVAICLLAFSGLLTWIGRKWRHRTRH